MTPEMQLAEIARQLRIANILLIVLVKKLAPEMMEVVTGAIEENEAVR